MAVIAQNHLQRVLTGGQIKGYFGLTTAKVDVVVICRKAELPLFRAIFAFTQRRAVQQDMVVTDVLLLGHARRGNAHTGQAEDNLDRRRHCVAVRNIRKIDRCAFWKRCLVAIGQSHRAGRDEKSASQSHSSQHNLTPSVCRAALEQLSFQLNTAKGKFIRLIGKKSSLEEIRAGLPTVYPRLRRYALVLSGKPDVADDLTQATCIRAMEKHTSYTPGTKLDRWLFRITHRIWLNELRSAAVRRAGGLVPLDSIDVAANIPDAETNIFAAEVFKEVMQLPEAMRVTVVLVYVEGYSYREAADLLDVPIGTIMSRLAAARKKLSGLASQGMRHAGE